VVRVLSHESVVTTFLMKSWVN